MMRESSSPHVSMPSLKVIRRLVLLSLQHILNLAVAELTIIGDEQLLPLQGEVAWVSHREGLERILSSFLDVIRDKMKTISGPAAQTLISAMLIIAYPPQHINDTKKSQEEDKIITKYLEEGHYGFAYILQMRRLQSHPCPEDLEIDDLLEDREGLSFDIREVIEKYELRNGMNDLGIDLTKTQLFIPRELFRIPKLVKAVLRDGRRDCLWRPVGRILYDNKVEFKPRSELNSSPGFAITNGCDVLGRSELHVICATGFDRQPDHNVKDLPERWPGSEMLGLNALHVAAIHGRTHIFQAALANGYDMVDISDHRVSSYTGRTYLHWAACYGHYQLVEYLLKTYKALNTSLKANLEWRDRKGYTASQLAAKRKHTHIVKIISQYASRTKVALAYDALHAGP
jgi:hypothetical protein